MKFKISVGESRFSTNWKNCEISWEQFLNKIGTPIRTDESFEQFIKLKKVQQDNLKDVGGFVAGEIKNGKRNIQNILNRSMITLDADSIEPGKTQKILRLVDGIGCTYAIYSTRKHSSATPRLRIIIPTNRTMTPDEYEPVARKIADTIGMEIMDRTTFDVNRLMYWPSCSKDSEFVFCYNTEPRGLASVDGILEQYKNWKDVSEWARASGEFEIIRKELKKLGNPTDKEGIVGTFCTVYDIHTAIDKFLPEIYESSDNPNKYHHIGSSTGYSASIMEDGFHMYSFHATDPAYKKACNAFDLVRIHKFGELDKDIKEGTPINRYPSYIEMCKFVDSLPEIKEARQQRAIAEFKEDPEKGLTDLFFENGKFDIEKFCKYFIENEHACNINNRLHIYNEGVYVADEILIQRKMIKLVPKMPDSKRNECLKYLRLLAYDNIEEDDKNYIAFKNGIFNIKTMQLEIARPEIVITNLIQYHYNPKAYSQLADNTLNKVCCSDNELRLLLEEMIGYTFYRNNKYAKSFFLYGPSSNNGKSVFLNLLKKILGERNYSTLAYEDLGDRFKTAEIADKLANIGDDCSKNFNSSSAIFKKLSTGETITVERKGQDPFGFNNYATLIFSFNELPRTEDKSQATAKKRMCIIPFNAKFKETDLDYDPDINDKLQQKECIEYVIKLGIEGLLRVINNKGFTKVQAVEKETENYEMYNNTVLQFLKEKESEENFNIEEYTPSQVYQQYKLWSTNNGFDKTVNNTTFGMEMKRLGYENRPYRLEGKLVRHYTKSARNK